MRKKRIRSLKFDVSPGDFVLINTIPFSNGVRRYYVHKKKRLIVVVRGNMSLHDLVGRAVDVAVGWDAGTEGYVLPKNVGKEHTKVTIFRVLRQRRADSTMREVLKRAP